MMLYSSDSCQQDHAASCAAAVCQMHLKAWTQMLILALARTAKTTRLAGQYWQIMHIRHCWCFGRGKLSMPSALPCCAATRGSLACPVSDGPGLTFPVCQCVASIKQCLQQSGSSSSSNLLSWNESSSMPFVKPCAHLPNASIVTCHDMLFTAASVNGSELQAQTL
jgi:hypothetical protein